MRKVNFSNPLSCGGTLAKKGEIIDLYSIEDVVNYPNITEDEIYGCEGVYEMDVVGFAKQSDYTDELPRFCQIYYNEVSEIES